MTGAHEAPEEVPAGTVLAVGDPVPPASTHKTQAAVLYSLLPVLLGAVLTVLDQATTLFAGAPTWVFTLITVLLILLTPVAAAFGVYRTANKLLQPVQVLAP